MIPYSCSDKFIVRIPFFQNLAYKNTPNILRDQAFREGLYISSENLYHLLSECDDSGINELSHQLQLTLTKFVTRMSTRSTPFGLFAAVGIAQYGEKSAIVVDQETDFNAVTSLNLDFFSELQRVAESSVPTGELIFFPNTTLFPFNDKFRYTEKNEVDGKVQYVIAEVPRTPYLERVLEAAKNGSTGFTLIDLLINEFDIADRREAEEFIDQLFRNQLIISDFTLSVTCGDYPGYVLKKLQDRTGCAALMRYVTEIREIVATINQAPITKKLPVFRELDRRLRSAPVTFDAPVHMISKTNLFLTPRSASISKQLVDIVKSGLHALNALTVRDADHALETFKQQFYNRYEFEEIPLMEALDPDIGIGYGNINAGTIKTGELINGIALGTTHPISPPLNVHPLLLRKYLECLHNGHAEIVLNDDDLAGYETDWSDTPLTFPVAAEVYRSGERSPAMLYLKYAGGFSAANVNARFCVDSEAIRQVVADILHYEEAREAASDVIVAEISYLPENVNSGTIVSRPPFREYEIPIFAFRHNESGKTIALSDITVSLDHDRHLVLRSKSLGKKIIPKNTTAHEFTMRTNPLYYFLSALQGQHMRYKFVFSWGNLVPHQRFFPRVSYKHNAILALARWEIHPDDIEGVQKKPGDLRMLLERRAIPQLVWLKDGLDNRLLLDFSEESGLALVQQALKKGVVLLEEYLFDNSDSLVTSASGCYNNDVLFNFFKR